MVYGKTYSGVLKEFNVSARYVGNGEFEDFKVDYRQDGLKIEFDPGQDVRAIGKAPDEDDISEFLLLQELQNNLP